MRISTLVVVTFLTINVFAGLMVATGIDAQLGMDMAVGGDSLENAVESQSDIATGSPGVAGTLFGLYTLLASTLGVLFNSAFVGFAMLERAGVPAVITQGLLTPIVLLAMTVDIISFLRGFSL